MQETFAREVLTRLPLAEAVLTLGRWVLDEDYLQDLFNRHRGACYDKVITFPVLVRVLADALLQHQGSGRQSFQRHRDELVATDQAAYQKLGRMPLALTEVFLAESTRRLLQVAPRPVAGPVPPTLQEFEVVALDGKAVKRVPKRLRPLRKAPGGMLGGKALVALDLRHELALAMATDADGETNDAKLVPDILPALRARFAGAVVLWLADRQFCDLNQTAAFVAEGHQFLVRYHSKTGFHPDATRPPRSGRDGQGRRWTEHWGWLGREGHPKRRYVRRITLERPGEEAILLVTSLLDAERYAANDLLALYLARWGIERVFQKITEVFHLGHLIGTTPEATLFQLGFCLLLYNLIQVVRGYVAAAAERDRETISTELLFEDVRRQLVALTELVPASRVAALVEAVATAAAVRAKLERLVRSVWTDRWIKAPRRKRQPPQKKSKRDHTSVYRILTEYRQKVVKDSPGG